MQEDDQQFKGLIMQTGNPIDDIYRNLPRSNTFVRPLRLIGHEIRTVSRCLNPLDHIAGLREISTRMVQERLSAPAL